MAEPTPTGGPQRGVLQPDAPKGEAVPPEAPGGEAPRTGASRPESLRPEEALDFICEEAKRQGAEKFDALVGESEALGLELFEGKVKSTEISNSRGIGIRLFKESRPGFAFTEKFTREAIAQAVRDALSHTALTDPVDMDLPHPASLPDLDLKRFEPALEEVALDEMKALGLLLEEKARALDKRIENIPYLGVSRSSGMSLIRNSNGVRYGSRSNGVSGGLGVVAAEGESRKMGIYSRGGRSMGIFDADFMAKKAVERAVELLGAEPLASGAYPVVFSHRVSGQVLSMFSSPYFAEAVQKGQSRLAGKVGERIGSPAFTLICDPHIVSAPGSQLFDGEGVATQRHVVVEAGLLKTYLYNLESAKKEGREPTGNGSRGYSGKAGTGFSNFIVPLGTTRVQDLLAAHPRCFYVTKLEGGSGCSAVSGEISIGAQGFLYEKGERVRPVDKVTLSSNYFDLLQGIEGFSDEYSDAFSSVKVPDFLVGAVHVAG